MLAFIFESVGFGEWFILLAVILIVVGPKRLPSTARKFGQYYMKFRRAAENFKRQLLDMDTEISQVVRDVEHSVEDVEKSVQDALQSEGDEVMSDIPLDGGDVATTGESGNVATQDATSDVAKEV